MDERQRYEQGMETRRAVLGDAYVEATLKNRDEFTDAFQDFITRYAWGEIWSRPGLPKETRSMLTLAMMVALNRPDELRMHLRAALNVGVTREQIQEVLLQSALYCGLPACVRAALHHGSFAAIRHFGGVDRRGGLGAFMWGWIFPWMSDHAGRKPTLIIVALISATAPLTYQVPFLIAHPWRAGYRGACLGARSDRKRSREVCRHCDWAGDTRGRNCRRRDGSRAGRRRSKPIRARGTTLDRERRRNIGFARVSVHDGNSPIQDRPAKGSPIHGLKYFERFALSAVKWRATPDSNWRPSAQKAEDDVRMKGSKLSCFSRSCGEFPWGGLAWGRVVVARMASRMDNARILRAQLLMGLVACWVLRCIPKH
jgi:4-carboxymuconolactone decarboxylase